jgi:hypothetical protein
MSSESSRPPRFTVHISGAVGTELRALQRRAARLGFGPEVNDAFRRIVERLQRDPEVFGEPTYRLPTLRLHLRTAAIRPLLIDYAVSEDRPHVYLKGVKLLPRDRR